MIRLAMLLIGAGALRRYGVVMILLGTAWAGLGLWLLMDATDGELFLTVEALGLLVALQGLWVAIAATHAKPRHRSFGLTRGALLLLLGVMIALPLEVDHGVPDRVVFGLAFLIDGALRIAAAYVVRFRHWERSLAAGMAELVFAWLVIGNWPYHHHYTVPMCLAMVLVTSGATLVQLALQLRQLPPDASITILPMYAVRRWHQRDRFPRKDPDAVFDHDVPMTLHVWTPRGSASEARHQPVIDRYVAAIDGQGTISTGHAAVECGEDVYISHYPAVEIDHSPQDFASLLRAGPENDVPGRWQPSHAVEVAAWCPPDQQVRLRVYDRAALRAFWEIYRRDNTYNLTSRSCSTVAAAALECALEGSLRSANPLLRLVRLLFDSNLWLAASLRRRATTMAWTPGLVLDYSRLLGQLVRTHRRTPAPEPADAARSPAA